MKLHYLIRDNDPSGVSGVGRVAEVVELENGKVVVAFLPHASDHAPEVSSVIVYDSLEDVLEIHGHGGMSWLESS